MTFAVNKFDLKNSVSIKSEIQGFQTISGMNTPNGGCFNIPRTSVVALLDKGTPN